MKPVKREKAYDLITEALPYAEENLPEIAFRTLVTHIDSYLDLVFAHLTSAYTSPTSAPGDVDGWISVDDDLPKEQTYVSVWVGGSVNQPVKHFYTSKGKWMNMETIILPKYYEVRLWQPLPAPPKSI